MFWKARYTETLNFYAILGCKSKSKVPFEEKKLCFIKKSKGFRTFWDPLIIGGSQNMNQQEIVKTAVITGASSGIGMEFARNYARMGYRLILTARRKERLEELSKELNTPCRIITADLADEAQCRALCDTLDLEPRIDVFINNAGFGTAGGFFETNLEKEISMIHVNIRAMHILLKRILTKMKVQGHGEVLNVASSAGLFPAGPYMATYYASKSYVVSLTKGIAEELREQHSKVYVCALCPGPVNTEFNENADVTFALPGISAKLCVKEALAGMRRRKTIIVPTFLMRFCTFMQRFVPDDILLRVVSQQQRKKTRRSTPSGETHQKA